METFTVTSEKAIEEALNNRKSVIEFRRRRLEAEKQVAQVKGNNRMKVNLNAILASLNKALFLMTYFKIITNSKMFLYLFLFL